ncbi:fatty acid desaturase [bacterium]|jgi:stearoyl-CoA desaturase (delta-9 desaturase)|nr:fatty acid desaturase [bacterium]
MTFLEQVLDPPHYGFAKDGKFYRPTHREIFKEFFSRLNIFQSKKNWLPFFSWTVALFFWYPFLLFWFEYFTWPLFIVGFIYGMVILGSHGTFWLHRFGTHRTFRFSSRWVSELCRNAVIRVIPEEVYIISHHVHHQISEEAGDPYNVHGGWLYCFLADATHQNIRKDLSERDYANLCQLMKHTHVRLNTYQEYLKWGTLSNPYSSVAHYAVNWAFWAAVFYAIGGTPLVVTIFAWTGIWAFGVRTFNFDGHGRGKDRRRDGIDFNRKDMSVNQVWPGYVAGEWHNNHHLYPNSARCGFLPYQADLPWTWIKGLAAMGGITWYRDCKEEFMENYYRPYLAGQPPKEAAPAEAAVQETSATPA